MAWTDDVSPAGAFSRGAMKLGQVWREGAKRLAQQAGDLASREAQILLGHLLDRDFSQLVLNENQLIDDAELDAYSELIERRAAGEPVARIVGHWEFYGRKFFLNDACLVPRPDTEILVDVALEVLAHHTNPTILDLGCGSGCIGLSIVAEIDGASCVGIDQSADAVAQAGLNAHGLGLASDAQFLSGSWFEPLAEGEKFDLIVSNPPYIQSDQIGDLSKEVQAFDPRAALDGGADGLDAYRHICAHAQSYLTDDGALVFEIGFDQAEPVGQLMTAAGFGLSKLELDQAKAILANEQIGGVTIFKDLTGNPRVAVGGVEP